MAKNIHFDDVLQPSSLPVAPAKQPTKPLISNIRPSLPFSDWACPSLPSQQMVNQLPFLHLCLPNIRNTETMQVVPSLSNCHSSPFASDSSAELSAPTCSSNKTGDSSTLIPMAESLFKQKQPFEEYDIRNELNDVDSAIDEEESEQSESGWTAYFDSSSDEEDDDEVVSSMRKDDSKDSSVVSDASSGPFPHFISSSKHQPLQKRVLEYEAPAAKLRRVGESKTQSQALEDTATSPLMQPSSSGMEGWQMEYKKIAKAASEMWQQQLHNRFKARHALISYIKR